MKVKMKGKVVDLQSATITKEQFALLERKFSPDSKLADLLECSTKNIGRIRKKYGLSKALGRPSTVESWKAIIIKGAKEGMSPADIVGKLGVNQSLVYKYYPKDILLNRTKDKEAKRIKVLTDDFNAGLTFDELCCKHSCANTTMRNTLSKAGLSIRARDAV